MANQINSRVLVDGPSVVDIEVTGLLDTSDLEDYVILDVAELEPVDPLSRAKATGIGIVSISSYSIQDGLTVEISLEAYSPNDIVAVLTGRGSNSWEKDGWRYCYEEGKTGRILLSTFGVVEGGEYFFTLILRCRKQTA